MYRKWCKWSNCSLCCTKLDYTSLSFETPFNTYRWFSYILTLMSLFIWHYILPNSLTIGQRTFYCENPRGSRRYILALIKLATCKKRTCSGQVVTFMTSWARWRKSHKLNVTELSYSSHTFSRVHKSTFHPLSHQFSAQILSLARLAPESWWVAPPTYHCEHSSCPQKVDGSHYNEMNCSQNSAPKYFYNANSVTLSHFTNSIIQWSHTATKLSADITWTCNTTFCKTTQRALFGSVFKYDLVHCIS